MNTAVSIIVCTCNRCENLGRFLESLAGLEVSPDVAWEIIVVDNNSTDRTWSVTAGFAGNGRLNIRYLFEGRQGKSHALNTGIRGANGEIVAFIDDDCIVDPHWMTHLVAEFRADPALAGIGGRVELFDVRDKPVTIRTLKERVLFVSSGQLFNLIPGCNMAFARGVFRKAGDFDVRFGPGAEIVSTEDSDFIYRVYRAGFRMLYCPDVCVYHNHGRRTETQVALLEKGYVTGRGAFYLKHILKGDMEVLKMAYWEIAALMRNISGDPHDGGARRKSGEHLRDLLAGSCRYLAVCRKSIKESARMRFARQTPPTPLQPYH